MEAISAIESMTKNMQKQTARNIQIAPAVPPLVREKTPEARDHSHVQPTAKKINTMLHVGRHVAGGHTDDSVAKYREELEVSLRQPSVVVDLAVRQASELTRSSCLFPIRVMSRLS